MTSDDRGHAGDFTPSPSDFLSDFLSDSDGYTSSLSLLLSCFLLRRSLWGICFSMFAENDVY